jgi:signal transduction histidine kinase
MRFFSQLFDAPAEIVIAHGRVVFALLSLVAITLDPTQPIHLAPLVWATLMTYATYAVVLLAALHRRLIRKLAVGLVHVIDLVIVTLLLVLTHGFSSPFLVFFTFVLLTASLRWDWRGIAATMAVLVLIAAIVAVIDSADRMMPNLNQTLIRGGYLIATGTILVYASAHREHERNRLAKLAQVPAVTSGKSTSLALAQVLSQAVEVIGASRALVVWEEDDGLYRAAVWRGGECAIVESRADHPPVTIEPELQGLTFSRTLPELDRLNLANGSVRLVQDALRGDLVAKLQIADFSSAPLEALAVRGRLFILGNIRLSDDHLPITNIIAHRVGTELDRQIFLERATRDAAIREREVIMRDLHDSLLQGLTAARAHLDSLPADGERARVQLQTVRDLLRTEQRRVREFVDATLAKGNESVAIETLRPLVDETARLWGCTVSLDLNSPSAVVPRRTLNQLSLMLAESVANAVRHGAATLVQITVTYRDGRLQIEIRDDGHGFTGIATAAGATEVSETELPRSLRARLRELGGQLRAFTSASGSVLRLEFST